MRFTTDVHHNEALPPGVSHMELVLTVRSYPDRGPATVAGARHALVVVVDTSGSMAGARIRAAKGAALAAINRLGDDSVFAIIAGKGLARRIYPPRARMARASAPHRLLARLALAPRNAGGGTAMSTWLLAAARVLERYPDAIRQVILLTDGQNVSDARGALDEAIATCVGQFQCDCRGVGTAWSVAELRKIADALLGSVDIVAEPDQLVAAFDALVAKARERKVPDVRLRVWTPKGARTALTRQVAPAVLELQGVAVDPQNHEYATGAWGVEEREYHLALEAGPLPVGEELAAARVGIVVGGEVVTSATVRANWSDDAARTAAIDPLVAHYAGQVELKEMIQLGLAARRAGDDVIATQFLGRAVQLATDSRHEGSLRLLADVVEIHDAETGRVTLLPRVDAADEMALDSQSVMTVRVRPDAAN